MTRRKKYFMPTEPADVEDPPYALIDTEVSVKDFTRMTQLLNDAPGKFDGTALEVTLASEAFITLMVATGVIKLGGNWEHYAGEWGEASPAWPRLVEDDEDWELRCRTVSRLALKDASRLALDIQKYMTPTEKERGNSGTPPESHTKSQGSVAGKIDTTV